MGKVEQLSMKRYVILLIVFLSLSLSAQEKPRLGGWFRHAAYGQSLLSDEHPNVVRFDVGGNTNRSEWDWGQTGKRWRINTFAVMGINVPIWSGNLTTDGRFGLSVSMPMSANIWLDLAEPVTCPIVDTDYRIALPQNTFIHRLNKGFAKNYSITLAPFKHESTHIGDELALQHADHGLPLRRVNVSCNYTEIDFTFNEPEERLAECHTFRVGLLLNWDKEGHWYFIDPTDGNPTLASPRNSRWEAWLQYQYQSPASKHGFQGVASLEIRNRAKMGYPEQDWDETEGVSLTPRTEGRIFTYNMFIGARYSCPNYTGMFSQFNVGVRLYHGNNPYGQFRNYTNFNQVNFCIIVQ